MAGLQRAGGAAPLFRGSLDLFFLRPLGWTASVGPGPWSGHPNRTQTLSDVLRQNPVRVRLPFQAPWVWAHHRGTSELEPGWSLRAKPRPFAREARSVPGDSRRWPLAGRVEGRPCASVREAVPSPALGSRKTPSSGGTGPLHSPALQDTACPRAQGRQRRG